ncbi:GrpB family protein [Paenibacillus sp. IB182493]|uniref:GrpB family protein n=1 Tax=Paenibacillus arenilitoris TaxID=2772299 RepID=A0A927H7R8_9BACL|nr:GrpB family protein [Paenibacillus arenilitoris]
MDNANEWPAWATETVSIAPYDPTWQARGEEAAKELQSLLAEFGVREIEHIGSTSVPGLPAKPILDLMARVDSLENIGKIAEKLAPFDWHFVPYELDKRAWRRFFVRVKGGKRVAHLHVMPEGEPQWETQLSFRDRLRLNKPWREEYADLKRELADRFEGDRESYTDAKAAFVHRIIGDPFAHFKHKHSRLIEGRRHIWNVEKLWRLADERPVIRIRLDDIPELDQDCWFGLGDTSAPTIRHVAGHCKRILDADMSYPILLGSDGALMDGGHRAAKSYMQGDTAISAVRFTVMPDADIILPEWQSGKE